MQEYNKIDIHLDSFPYTGITTTAEALWMGAPVITLVGQRIFDILSGDLLQAVGLSEMLCYSKKEYVEKAVELASKIEYRRELRQNLRAAMKNSSLSNPLKFCREIETAYREVYNA